MSRKKDLIKLKGRLGSAAFDRAITNRRRLKLRKLSEEDSEARGIMGKTNYFESQ
jgi:hypothetical protein